MSDLYLIPESIECDSALLIARKMLPVAIIDHEELGRCWKYTCDRNSSAEIMKELDINMVELINEKSKVKKDDRLYCEGLFVLVQGIKRLKIKLRNESGTHKAQESTTKSYTYAEITKPFEHIINAIEKRKLDELK